MGGPVGLLQGLAVADGVGARGEPWYVCRVDRRLGGDRIDDRRRGGEARGRGLLRLQGDAREEPAAPRRDGRRAPGEGDDRWIRARRADREVHGLSRAEPAARGDRGLDGSRVNAAVPPLPLYVRLYYGNPRKGVTR